MSKSIELYRDGSAYRGLINQIKKQHGITTRQQLVDFSKSTGKTEKQANADVTVVLSPRKSSKRGDCRGNISAWGWAYYMEKLGRSVKAGVKAPQAYRLRYREVALEPRTRNVKVEVKQVKESKTRAPAKEKTTKATKETVTA